MNDKGQTVTTTISPDSRILRSGNGQLEPAPRSMTLEEVTKFNELVDKIADKEADVMFGLTKTTHNVFWEEGGGGAGNHAPAEGEELRNNVRELWDLREQQRKLLEPYSEISPILNKDHTASNPKYEVSSSDKTPGGFDDSGVIQKLETQQLRDSIVKYMLEQLSAESLRADVGPTKNQESIKDMEPGQSGRDSKPNVDSSGGINFKRDQTYQVNETLEKDLEEMLEATKAAKTTR